MKVANGSANVAKRTHVSSDNAKNQNNLTELIFNLSNSASSVIEEISGNAQSISASTAQNLETARSPIVNSEESAGTLTRSTRSSVTLPPL